MKNFVILLVINIGLISSDPLLFRGRSSAKYGMLGSPAINSQLYSNVELPEEQWLEQKLNHFDPVDTRTWKQRYFVNDTFHKSGGPVFLNLFGEGEASPIWIVEGPMATNYAKRYNAMSVLLEHRYYGMSRPTKDLSVENLRYLTSEQALQDVAHFIEYLTSKLSLKNSKWVVFGASYSGSLAVWFRAKYPHLVVGAIASSATVQAVIDYKGYLDVVIRALGQRCLDSIREATDHLTQELQRPLEWTALQKQFKLCDPFNGTQTNDVYNLVRTLVNQIYEVVQCNRENRQIEGVMANITIDVMCDVMNDHSLTPIGRYQKVNEIILKAYNKKCVDYKYDHYIEQLRQTDWNSSEASDGERQWIYQTCVEFGFYRSSDVEGQPFGPYFPLDFFVKRCADIFGPQFNLDLLQKGVNFTNNVYGGLGLKVRKVLFINGSMDPWHVAGVTHDLNPESKALLINGTAHCADMYPESDDDSPELKEARKLIVKTLGQFLNDSELMDS